MSTINIRESLRQLDDDSFCKYDLLTMYDSCPLLDEDKQEIAKLLYDKEDPEVIYQKLCTYFCDDDVSSIDEINDIPVSSSFETIVTECLSKLKEIYDDAKYNDVANQIEVLSKGDVYTTGLSPVDYDFSDIEVFVDGNYDEPMSFDSIEDAVSYILNTVDSKISTTPVTEDDDDVMIYTVYDIVEDDDRLTAKCMNESTNDFQDIKLGKVNSQKVNELLNNMLNNPNYKITDEVKKKIYDKSAPWGLAVQMVPSVDVDGTNGLLSTGSFSGEASFGESFEQSFEKDDRVTDGSREGTVLDSDSQKVLVEWDYSETDDIEWVDKSDLSFVGCLKESEIPMDTVMKDIQSYLNYHLGSNEDYTKVTNVTNVDKDTVEAEYEVHISIPIGNDEYERDTEYRSLLFRYKEGKWQPVVTESRYDAKTKTTARKLVDKAKADGKKLSMKDAEEIVDQSYNDKADNIDDFYKSLDLDESNEDDFEPQLPTFDELRKQYNNYTTFKDKEKNSGLIRDLCDQLENKKVSYDIYNHKNDNGMTIFYDDCDLVESLSPYKKEEFKKQLQDELYDKFIDLARTPEWGFEDEKEIEDLLMPVIEVKDYKGEYDNDFVAEIRGEFTYDELDDIASSLDPIVQKYDKEAYFEPVTSGITRAYLKLEENLTEGYTDYPEVDFSFTNKRINGLPGITNERELARRFDAVGLDKFKIKLYKLNDVGLADIKDTFGGTYFKRHYGWEAFADGKYLYVTKVPLQEDVNNDISGRYDEASEHLMDLIYDEVSAEVIDYYIDNFGSSFIITYNNNLDNIRNEAINLSDILTKNGYKVRDWATNGDNILILKFAKPISLNEGIEDNDELISAEQEFDSAATSINSNKLPAVYSMVRFNPGDVVVDFGGGKFDNAVNHLKDQDVTLLVYDPYNRSAEHNKEVLKVLKEHGGADAAVNSNVLNVIKEPEARNAVLQNIKKITKKGAPIYITVYEGSGKGNEGPTKSGYQLNRKTADYMDEIGQVFSNVKRKGKLITAINESYSHSDLRQANVDAIEYFIEFEDIYPFPKEKFLASSWKDLRDGVEMGMDDDLEIAEGIMQYLQKEIDFNNRHKEIYEDDPQAELTLEIYNKVKRGYEEELSEMELSETLSDRIRNNELDYDEELDAYSAEEDGIYIQLQDRELDEYQAAKNSEKGLQIVDKQPRVSSNTWGRIWKDGKLIKTFKGPKYKVRADMTKYLENYLKDTKFGMNRIIESADNGLSYNSIRYKGYRISLLTDGSGYAIFDKHGEMEDHGFKSIKDAKSAIDEFNSIYKPVLSKGLSEASYGGAFDIEDDQYFTRDELIEFAEDVVERLNTTSYSKFDYTKVYMEPGNVLELTLVWSDYEETIKERIDMRKIRKPFDLIRIYSPLFVFKARDAFSEVGADFGPHLSDQDYPMESLSESTSNWRYVASKMVPDSDGFLTDYTWYENTKDGRHVFIFGDNDLYDDVDSNCADWETNSYSEARSWFDNYHGFDKEDMRESLSNDNLSRELQTYLQRLFGDYVEVESVKYFKSPFGEESYTAEINVSELVDNYIDKRFTPLTYKLKEDGYLYVNKYSDIIVDVNGYESGVTLDCYSDVPYDVDMEQLDKEADIIGDKIIDVIQSHEEDIYDILRQESEELYFDEEDM